VLAVGVAMGMLGAALIGALWAVVSVGHHRVDAAADLVALSAAQALQSGTGDPCGAAQRIAVDHQVELARCQVSGETVSIEVAVELRLGALGSPKMTSEARAGPLGGD
jgi:secretion/DNA translocation related TadE-like protein